MHRVVPAFFGWWRSRKAWGGITRPSPAGRHWWLGVGAAACAGPLMTFAAAAATIEVAPGTLAQAISAAAPGDTLVLLPGVHRGGVTLDKALSLVGRPGAVIDGGGVGSTITIAAPDGSVRGLTIRNSGRDVPGMNAGVFLGKEADGAVVADNLFEGNLFGVYVWGPDNALVTGNRIDGLTDIRVNERGNGVSLWNSPGTRIENNHIRHGRDGIFTNASKRNVFSGNRFEDVRFAVHYMYTNDSVVSGNVSIGNDIGYALMYSRGIKAIGNVSQGDRDHGIALNSANDSQIIDNVVTDGGEKCVFIYNSNKSQFRGNTFEGCAIGVHFTAGSERNHFQRNAFIGNETQVKYVGTRHLDWATDGVGNYWSDNVAFDLNGDGIADMPYRPNDLVDQVVWRAPAAKLLLNSPAVQVVRWAQTQFPALLPGGIVDTAPLMSPPDRAAAPSSEE